MNPILPVLLFFLNTSPAITADEIKDSDSSSFTIYLVKQRWHTGIVFQRSKVDTNLWKEINDFKDAEWIDVGWGDKEFYQYPGFDPGLAVKALFYPTPSTLRVAGIYISIEKYAQISDAAVKINLTKEQFDSLSGLISNSYSKNENNEPVILNKREISTFYEAEGNYHLFNTCNTWVAEKLKKIGFDISDDIILVEQLLNEVQEFGIVVKGYE